MSTVFTPRSPHDVLDFVKTQMFAQVISASPGSYYVTPLPLLASADADGQVVEFFGHFARSNPQVEAVSTDPRVLILFQGPHAYISPAWVSQPGWAPTWNYAIAQFEAEVCLVPEQNDCAIRELSWAIEGDGWCPAAMGERYERMLVHIVAFRARVTASEAKFKLGQDESETSFHEILQGLGDGPLVRQMQRARR